MLSTSTLISPVNIPFLNTKKAATLNVRTMKPSSSTGAIPKSISFDMSAEKGDKEDEDGRGKRGSFFGKLKMGFKNRRGKAFREEYGNVRFEGNEDEAKKGKRIEAVVKANNTGRFL